MKNSIILASITAFLAGGATIAQADAGFEARSVTVRFADLDTSGTAGATTLFHRLKVAAAISCEDLEPGRELARVRAYAGCLDKALGDAIARIDRPTLTAVAAIHGVTTRDTAIRVAVGK